MRVPLPDGSVRELPDGSTGADLAADIGPGLARAAMAIRVLDGDKTEKRDGTAYDDGRIVDLSLPLADGQPVEIVTAKAGDGDALKLLRHDIAHVLAESVLELYPGTKVSIGPPIADGFYYDFEFPPGVTAQRGRLPEDRSADEEAREGRRAVRALRAAGRRGDRALPARGPAVQGRADRGPGQEPGRPDGRHLPERRRSTTSAAARTRPAPAARRRSSSRASPAPTGAATPNRQMLTRIYGTAFATKDELAEHLERLEQARARDHRKLGKELELFMFSELSPGSPFWMPNGMAIWNELTKLWRDENTARGYREVHTPILYDAELFKQLRALARVPRQHVLHGRRGPVDGPEADELPGAHAALRVLAALVPRPADPLLRAGPRAPPRAVRHAARPAARPPHHAGRRAHLRHRGPDRGRGRPRARVRVRDLRALRLRAAAGALDAAREAHRHRGDVGQGRGGAAEGARQPRPGRTRSTRATARSTGRRSTCT